MRAFTRATRITPCRAEKASGSCTRVYPASSTRWRLRTRTVTTWPLLTDVEALAPHVDGVVVGSALIDAIDRGEDPGGVLDALYRHANAVPLERPRDFPIYNASLNWLAHRNGRWSVERWGDIAHLTRDAALDDF